MVTTTLVTTTLPRSVSSRHKDHILSLIKSVSGQANVIAVPRLFVQITGDPCLAMMLSQLLYWSDRATRGDGLVYKSSKDWIEELGVTDYTVRKFKKLPYIQTRVIKANGSPTTHYRIHYDALVELVMQQRQFDAVDIANESDHNDMTDGPDRPSDPAKPTVPPVDSSDSLTETTTEINSEITTLKGEQTKKIPPSIFQTDGSIQNSDTNPQEPEAGYAPPETPTPQDDFQAFCAALGKITGYDRSIRSNAHRLSSASHQLIHAGYTIPHLERFLGWWKTHDWRWKKDSQLPSPEDVLTNIARAKSRRQELLESWKEFTNYDPGG
jgi:hypothetical protein